MLLFVLSSIHWQSLSSRVAQGGRFTASHVCAVPSHVHFVPLTMPLALEFPPFFSCISDAIPLALALLTVVAGIVSQCSFPCAACSLLCEASLTRCADSDRPLVSMNQHTAAGKGDLGRVQQLVTAANVDERDQFGRTVLHCACNGGHAEMVTWLLGVEADINTRDREGWTSLHWAADNSHPRCIQLLDSGADASVPLHWAHMSVECTAHRCSSGWCECC